MMRPEILKALSQAPGNNVPPNERDMWLDHQLQMRDLAASGGRPVDSLQRDGRHLRFTLIETPRLNQIEITTDITEAVNDHMNVERSPPGGGRVGRDQRRRRFHAIANTIRVPHDRCAGSGEMLNDTALTSDAARQAGHYPALFRQLLGIMQDMMQTAAGVVAASGEHCAA